MIVLRPATRADLEGVVDVFHACWTTSYGDLTDLSHLARLSRADAQRIWRQSWPTGTVWVADDARRVVGVVRWSVTGETVSVHSLYVDPSRQGQGVGRRLLDRALDEGRSAGGRHARLWVFAGNTSGLAFYRRCGFAPDGATRTQDAFGVPEVRVTRTDGDPAALARLLVSDEVCCTDPADGSVGEGPPAGAVVARWRAGEQPTVAAAGVRAPDGAPVTADTAFDLASVTKLFTTAALMRLVHDGRVALDDAVDRWVELPAPVPTVRQLLRHRSGLQPWQPLYRRGDRTVAATLRALPRAANPDERFLYSDLGFMVLGWVVEAVTGVGLADALDRLVLGPLRVGASYGPRAGDVATSAYDDGTERRMVATGEPYPILLTGAFDAWSTDPVTGVVNDGNARHALHQVAGHAGMFGRAADLVRLGQAFLDTGHGLWNDAVVAEFTSPGPDPGQGLGFRLGRLPGGQRLAYHPGFTGTSLGIGLGGTPTVVAMLTNRLLTRRTPVPTARLWARVLQATDSPEGAA